MAYITPDSYADVDAMSASNAIQMVVTAGEALSPCLPVQIRSDGLAYMATTTYKQTQSLTVVNGASASTVATFAVTDFDGIVARSYATGEKATVFGKGTKFHLKTSLTPGNGLYVSGSSTTFWSTDPKLSGDLACAKVISTTDAVVIR